VLRIFLVEATALGLLGGLLGTVLGWMVARAVSEVVNGYLAAQGLVGVQLGIPVLVVAGGIVGSAVLSLVAGTVPALRAARLADREARRLAAPRAGHRLHHCRRADDGVDAPPCRRLRSARGLRGPGRR
jgi:hypothetical protein